MQLFFYNNFLKVKVLQLHSLYIYITTCIFDVFKIQCFFEVRKRGIIIEKYFLNFWNFFIRENKCIDHMRCCKLYCNIYVLNFFCNYIDFVFLMRWSPLLRTKVCKNVNVFCSIQKNMANISPSLIPYFSSDLLRAFSLLWC